MAHTNSTPNYNLPQFLSSDKPAWLTDVNAAYSAIDTGMKNAQDAADDAQNDATQALQNSASAASTATSADAKGSGALVSIAPAFADDRTYAVGDIVIYNNLLYICTVPVVTPSAWTGSANWARTTIAAALVLMAHPVGSIYISTNSINPGLLFGGTWEAYGTGKTLVGIDSTDEDFDTVNKTGGEKTHTLTIEEMPAHYHVPYEDIAYFVNYNGTVKQVQIGGGTNNNCDLQRRSSTAGGNQAHNNMPPYIVTYMFRRTA